MPPKLKADTRKIEADRLTALLQELLREEENKYCSECEAKQPRWASWNLGVFLCIRCAGLHRNLGVHISKVKSVNLDSWTAEQVQSMRVMGNAKAKAVYEAELPSMFRRPQSDQSLEAFIRAKYEAKRYILKDWSPPPVNVADCYSDQKSACSPGFKSGAVENSLSHPKKTDERVERRKSGNLTNIPMSAHSNQSPNKSAQVPNLLGSQVDDSPAVLVNLFDSPVHSSAPATQQNENFATQISENLDDLFGPIVSAENNISFPLSSNGQVQSSAGSAKLPSLTPDHQKSAGLVGSTSAEANLFALGGLNPVSLVEPQLESVNFNDTTSQSDNKKTTMDIMALFGSNPRPAPSQSLPAFNSFGNHQLPSPSFPTNLMANAQSFQHHQPAATAAPAPLSGLDDLFGQFKM